MSKLKNTIEDRDVSVMNALYAALFGGIEELGMLSQVTATLIGRRTGTFLCDYFSAIDDTPDVKGDANQEEDVQAVCTFLNDRLELAPVIEMNISDSNMEFAIESGKCRICPIGVGGLELEGTACPIPSMLNSFLNYFLEDEFSIDKIDGKTLNKKGDICHFKIIK